MIFGDKKIFAIEIDLENSIEYAHVLLYISNIYIGKKSEITYLHSFLASLELRLIDQLKPLPKAFSNLPPKEIANILFNNEYFTTNEAPKVEKANYELLDELLIANLEDTFDHFDIMAYKDSNDIIFCWKVDLDYHDCIDYFTDIYCKKINYSYVKSVIDDCTASLQC